MVPSAAGAVVLLPFPFSDLSQSKLRPALVLAAAGRDDWVLAQNTSRPYGDPLALDLDQTDFATGSLNVQSFVRPGKLFAANAALVKVESGVLRLPALERVLVAVVKLLKP